MSIAEHLMQSSELSYNDVTNIIKDVLEVRAYHIWEDAGREHGNYWAHWFKAKEDLGLSHLHI